MPAAPEPQQPPNKGISDWEATLADQRVRRFLSVRPPLPGFDAEDLAQECLAHWFIRRTRYQAERGASPKTFMRRVVDAKLLDLEREVRAARRSGHDAPLSLDAPLRDAPGTLGDLLLQPGNEAEQEFLRSAIRRAIDRLSLPQSEIVSGVAAGESVTEISQRVGRSRSTIYDELKGIRAVFRDEGLEEFLR